MWKLPTKKPVWRMKAHEFQNIIREKPDFLATIDPNEKIRVEGAVNLNHSRITHLSRQITFENAVSIMDCTRLKVAEGTFLAPVDFSRSDIEEIGELIVDVRKASGRERIEWGTNREEGAWKPAADFTGCKNLKVARGTFLGGGVSFHSSGVEEILSEELHIDADPKKGGNCSFHECFRLKVARGTFPGHVSFHGNWNLERIDTHPITGLKILGADPGGRSVNFCLCKKLKVADGKYPGSAYFTNSGIERVAKTFEVSGPYAKIYMTDCEYLVEINTRQREDFILDDETAQRVAHEEEKRARARQQLKQPALEL